MLNVYKLTNLREFNETLNYCSQQIREGSLLLIRALKKRIIQKKIIKETKICGQCIKLSY